MAFLAVHEPEVLSRPNPLMRTTLVYLSSVSEERREDLFCRKALAIKDFSPGWCPEEDSNLHGVTR